PHDHSFIRIDPLRLLHTFLLSLPLPTPRSTLFPYTTLFRSAACRSRRMAVGGSPTPIGRWHDGVSALPSRAPRARAWPGRECRRSEEHTSELQSRGHLVCRLLLEKKKI